MQHLKTKKYRLLTPDKIILILATKKTYLKSNIFLSLFYILNSDHIQLVHVFKL